MENEVNNNDQSLVGANDELGASNGAASVESVLESSQASSPATPKEEALSLAEINTFLGKEFKDKATALKSLKDTFSYVGKRKEDIVKEEVQTKGYMTKDEFEKEFYFRDNPSHAPYREVLEAIASSKGINIKDAAESDTYKQLVTKASEYDKVQAQKSVLETNPRLAQVKNELKQVDEFAKSGRTDEASMLAAQSILERMSS